MALREATHTYFRVSSMNVTVHTKAKMYLLFQIHLKLGLLYLGESNRCSTSYGHPMMGYVSQCSAGTRKQARASVSGKTENADGRHPLK